jgi:hypothetical protein
MPDDGELMEALAAPFAESEVKIKPQIVKGNRALVIHYIDARVIQDRLDHALGVNNWQDDYECLDGGSVLCRLKIRVGGEWLVKVDVGSPSEQPDEGDRVKAAFSDALKRAAVKFGVGRYIYRLPQVWCEYDPAKKQVVKVPRLPPWALPKPAANATAGEPQADPAELIGADEVQALEDLAWTRGKTREACVQSVGRTPETPWLDLTVEQYRTLRRKLDAMPRKHAPRGA